MVNDVLLARLPLHLSRLAFLRVHDDGFVRRPLIVHRLRACLSAQLRQGSRTVEYVFPSLLTVIRRNAQSAADFCNSILGTEV